MLKGEKQKAINYLNVAIELDSSIYKEIETQSIFLPIIKSIKAPNLNNTLNIPISKLTKKENQTIKHLKDTYYLVNKLNNEFSIDFIEIVCDNKDTELIVYSV